MNNIDRAKQFMPFDALSGLTSAFREREERHSMIERKELSEDEKETISKVLAKVSKGMLIEINFYLNGKYYDLIDRVVKIQPINSFVQLGETKIFFDDIFSVEIIEQ